MQETKQLNQREIRRGAIEYTGDLSKLNKNGINWDLNVFNYYQYDFLKEVEYNGTIYKENDIMEIELFQRGLIVGYIAKIINYEYAIILINKKDFFSANIKDLIKTDKPLPLKKFDFNKSTSGVNFLEVIDEMREVELLKKKREA